MDKEEVSLRLKQGVGLRGYWAHCSNYLHYRSCPLLILRLQKKKALDYIDVQSKVYFD